MPALEELVKFDNNVNSYKQFVDKWTKTETPIVKENQMTRIEFQCGCGFKTVDQSEAEEHARVKNHNMTVHGSVTVKESK